jgi:hypothetical protein
VWSFTYRDAYEEFSNRYHFDGTPPADPVAWKTFADTLTGFAVHVFGNDVRLQRAYGYVAGSVASVWSFDYGAPPATPILGEGTFSGMLMPGDVAGTTRWETGALNSRGKKIYLRKYWHGVHNEIGHTDQLGSDQVAAFNTFAGQLADGSAFGGANHLAGPNGAVAGTHSTSLWLTTRTLKRRGRRPLP